MKKLLLLILLFISFLLFPKDIFASDLDVNCGSSVCILSSHDPIFSADTQWTPEKSETKEVLINNTDSVSKEIFIRARNNASSTKELDSFININLFNAGNSIWQGSLADFINAGDISVADISGGDTFMLLITAEMESGIPNSMQGKSSVFNFGFGFEGQSTNQASGEISSPINSNNSSSEASNNSTSDDQDSGGGLDILGDALNRVFGIFEDSEAGVGIVAGEETNISEEKEERDVLGAGDSACKENYLWVVFIIMQILFSTLLYVPRFKNRLRLMLSGDTILFSVSIAVIYFISCFLWPMLISSAIFLVNLGLLLFMKYKFRN